MAQSDNIQVESVLIDIRFFEGQVKEAISLFFAPFAAAISTIGQAASVLRPSVVPRGGPSVAAGPRDQGQLRYLEQFKLAVEAARCGIWEWDLSTDQVFLSDVTAAMLGWDGGGGVFEGAQVLSRIAPDHRERVRNALDGAKAYGAFDVSFRVPDRGGRTAWVDARGQGLDPAEGGFGRIIGVALDVTDERIAQARAQAAESRLRDAINSASEAFVLWDRRGRLLVCNENFRKFFSLEARMLKPGSSRESVSRFAQLAIRQEHRSPLGGGVREAELNDGRWLQISHRRTAEGGRVVTAIDITAIKQQEVARRRHEEALRGAVHDLQRSQEQLSELARKYEAEKIRAEGADLEKGEFLANMSKELRPALNAINSRAEAILSERFGTIGNVRYHDEAQLILSGGQHLMSILNDMLDMSNIELGERQLKFETFQIRTAIEEAVKISRERLLAANTPPQVDLRVELSNLPEVEADYRAIKYVLITLISNALPAVPSRGHAMITARLTEGGDRLLVSIETSGAAGKAINQGLRGRRVTKVAGSRFGLGLTRSLVEMHGGTLELAGTASSGMLAAFTIPIYKSSDPETKTIRRLSRRA
jgi:two-component system cell cycle sensor histidine kinase PleC